VRVGCYLDLRNPPRWARPWAEHSTRTLERCVEAERLGLDSVWCSEHHFFEDGYLPQPLTFLAGVAATTSRIRLGTAVYLAALRPPVQVAEEAAVVDLPSGGRLELGLGEGRGSCRSTPRCSSHTGPDSPRAGTIPGRPGWQDS